MLFSSPVLSCASCQIGMLAETGLPLGLLALTGLWMVMVAVKTNDPSGETSAASSVLTGLGCFGGLFLALTMFPLVLVLVFPALMVALATRLFSKNPQIRKDAAIGLAPFLLVLGIGWFRAGRMTPMDRLASSRWPSDRIARTAGQTEPLGLSWNEIARALESPSEVAAENATNLLLAKSRRAEEEELEGMREQLESLGAVSPERKEKLLLAYSQRLEERRGATDAEKRAR